MITKFLLVAVMMMPGNKDLTHQIQHEPFDTEISCVEVVRAWREINTKLNDSSWRNDKFHATCVPIQVKEPSD